MNKAEALKEIQQTAEMILTKSQSPAVRVRLLRDILHRPHDDPELLEAREQLEKIEWIRLLTENQHQYDWTTRILLLLQKYYEGS